LEWWFKVKLENKVAVITGSAANIGNATALLFAKEGTLIKPWIQPEEIAEALLYLATAKAVTGENLIVDGGYTT
jgi:NAD(P)-dependent dehydrogenase (short-subunit alcohol dehydrogenase family)